MLADVGLTEQQWRVLRVLDEAGPSDPTRIAEAASLLLPSLTRILQKLEAKGMIDRAADPEDRRRQVVRITETGAGLIAQNQDRSVALSRHVEEMLGEEKHGLLLDLLNELSALDLDAQPQKQK